MLNDNLQQQAQALFDDSTQSCTNYATLGSIADVKGGKRLPKGINLITQPNSHPYIRVRDLNNTLILQETADFEYVDDVTQRGISRYIVKERDVLLSIVGTIGLTALVHDSLNDANLTENCVKITNLKKLFPEYILLFLRSDKGKAEIMKNTVGAVQAKLPLKNIQAISIPLITNSALLELEQTLTSIFAIISNNLSENLRLATLRDTLLPRLMSGEIDVSEVDI